MRTYRISPSLLNSFSGWLNSDETYNKFWGNSESPAMSADEFTQKQFAELLAYINKAPQPLNEAADRGTCLNEIIDCLIGAEPNTGVWWDKIDGRYMAERNGFHFEFAASLVEELEVAMRNGIPQYHLSNTYQPTGCDYQITLHGYADYIFPTQIIDLKTTNKYECEKYAGNWQREVYPVVAVDSGDMLRCDAFTFHVVELYQPKNRDALLGKIWRERYDVNVDESRAKVIEFITNVVIPNLDQWHDEGLTPYQTICNYV